jgi:hypothetical protein
VCVGWSILAAAATAAAAAAEEAAAAAAAERGGLARGNCMLRLESCYGGGRNELAESLCLKK